MVFASRGIKCVIFVFTFSYIYTIAVAGRIDDTTPQVPVAFAILCNFACLVVFFWFAQRLGGSLRPIAVLQNVADEGHTVLQNVYPDPFDPAEKQPGWSSAAEADVVVVEHDRNSGIVLSFDELDLVAIAQSADAEIEMVPQVGDFVARGDPLFRIRRGGGPIEPRALRGCVAIGPERTIEQDPRFAFRIMVDIANKALSPAINDPTTAVLALDQIHRLLMHVGKRRLDAGVTRDVQGRVRLYYGTPDWIDFVSLAITEIRQYGAGSIQVARRLQAMIEHLLLVLPEARRPALQQELALLGRATQRAFPDEEDRARCRVGDMQGIGGSESAS
jgi:uncharacterized membrane protein